MIVERHKLFFILVGMPQQSSPCSVPGMQRSRRYQESMQHLKITSLSVGNSQTSGSGFICHSMQESISPTASQFLCCLLSREKMMAFHAQQPLLHA